MKKCESTFLDLNTKRSVAFYAALAVALHSGFTHGWTWPLGAGLLALAGLATGDVVMKKGGGDEA